jgi:hypothetical protein
VPGVAKVNEDDTVDGMEDQLPELPFHLGQINPSEVADEQ